MDIIITAANGETIEVTPKRVDIGHRIFLSQRLATEHLRRILYKYSPGEVIFDPTDDMDVAAFLARHPDAVKKIGCGVECFFVQKDCFKGQCFGLRRKDGSSTDFSYKTCVTGRKNPIKTEIALAFRDVIFGQIREKKRQAFEKADADGNILCQVSGIPISWDNCHADHAPPLTFEVLVLTFCGAHGVILSEDLLLPSSDNQMRPRLKSEEIAKKFSDFHASVARIRLIKKDINLQIAGLHRIR